MKRIIVLFLFIAARLVTAQEMRSYNINLTDENMESIKTDFLLLFNIKEIKNIDTVKDPVTKKAILTTKNILDSMQKGDMRSLAELSFSQREIDFFNSIIPIHQKMYKNSYVEFIAQIALEEKYCIIYKTFMENQNQKTPVILYSLLCKKNNNFVFVFPNDIETMIVQLACKSLSNGMNIEKYISKKGVELHKLRIYQDHISNNDCYLLFTGIPVHNIDVSMYDDQHEYDINIVHDILTLFKSSLNDIKTKSTEEYAELYYTKKSAETFVNSLSKMQKEGLEIYQNRIYNGGYVIHYIIDASPYYVVFYTQKENKLEISEKKTQKYNYIYCIKKDQKLKFTNFLKSNTFLDILIKKKIIDIDQVINQE